VSVFDTYAIGLDMLCCAHGRGEHVLGADEAERDRRVSDRAKKMAELKQVPVSIAQALLAGGQAAIGQAKKLANSHIDPLTGVPMPLPGGTARDTVVGKLQWHAAELKKFAATPNAIYPSGDDLKKWVLQAFTEYDAVLEGLATLDHAWSEMWDEIATRLAELPKEIAKAVTETVSTATKWLVGGAIVIAVIGGFVVYKVATGPSSKIIVPHYLNRGRR